MHNKNSAGFTLLEVLIAVIIFSTGLVLVVEAMGRTQQAIGISQNLIAACGIAQEKITESQLRVLERHKLEKTSEEGKEKLLSRDFAWEKKTRAFQDPTIRDETKLNQVDIRVAWSEGARHNLLNLSAIILNHEKKE